MARGLNVFVNIGAKVGASFGSAIRGAESRLEGMGRRVKVIGAEMKASLRGVEEAQSRRMGVLFSGAAFAYGASRAIDPFVRFEDALVRMGNTAEVRGPQLEKVGNRIQKVGAQFGYTGTQAVAGVNDFVAAGLDLETSLGALGATLKLTKTAGVEIIEGSQAGISVMQNLGVNVRNLADAYDIMAKAGKEGRFEINDMAKAFPALASRAKLMGMEGLDGVRRISSMLQIVRINARDADEASNNLLNLFDKFTGNETLQHFDKMGVSIEGVWKRSQKNGTQFVDEMLSEIGRLTKGGTDAFALTKLFPDRQARQAALALLQNKPEYNRIYGATSPEASKGTLGTDFGAIQKTSRFGLDKFWAGLERIGVALGKAFGPMLGEAAQQFAVLAEQFAAWAEKNPGIVKMIGLVVGGLVALRTAGAAVGLLFGGVFGRVARFLGGKLFGLLAQGFGRLVPLLLNGLTRLAPLLIRGLLAFFSGPLGWAALAASLVYYFWPEIKKGWAMITGWFTNTAWPAIKATASAALSWGATLVDNIKSGIAGAWEGLKGWFKGKWNELAPSIMQFGGAGGSLLKLGVGAANVIGGTAAPGRALGGSVSAGMAYEWHERGREYFVPGRSGTVINAATVAAMNRGGGGSRGGVSVGNVNIYGANDPAATEAAVYRALNKLAGGQAALLSD